MVQGKNLEKISVKMGQFFWKNLGNMFENL